jgi:hypothetical protein
MAGHSKWANTKHRKAAQDAKRGKIFTKIIRELVTAARLGGGDAGSLPDPAGFPATNPAGPHGDGAGVEPLWYHTARHAVRLFPERPLNSRAFSSC